MLSNTQLSTTIIAPALEELFKEFDYSIDIIEDNQDVPRPLSSSGFIKNYLFYKILPLKQISWPNGSMIDTVNQKMLGEYELTVMLNMLGEHASDMNNYLIDTIASVHGDIAFHRNGVQLYYNTLTDPIDLTEIENTKWVKRVQRNIIFGYKDTNTFTVGSFTDVEHSVVVDNGITQKVIISRPRGENNGI